MKEALDSAPGARMRRRARAVLAGIAASAVGGFFATSRALGSEWLRALDERSMRRFGEARGARIDAVAKAVTSLASVPGVAVVSLAAIVASRDRPRASSQIALGALGGILSELVVKRRYLRPRPTLFPHLERVTSTSFPSGHSMAAASLYLTLAFVASRSLWKRPHGLPFAVASALASGVALSRVHLGVHWSSDVVAGLALGTGWASAVEAVFT